MSEMSGLAWMVSESSDLDWMMSETSDLAWLMWEMSDLAWMKLAWKMVETLDLAWKKLGVLNSSFLASSILDFIGHVRCQPDYYANFFSWQPRLGLVGAGLACVAEMLW